MEIKEMDFGPEDIVASFLNIVAYIISPILFIWGVNTLFNCGIPLTFKTWLAGFVLIMLMKFHLRGTKTSHYYYDDDEYDEYYDDDDEYDDDDDEYDEEYDADDYMEKRKAKLIAYQDHKNKKNPPSEKGT